MEIDNSQVRILLVDNNPINLEIAGKLLEQEEYDLYIADNGMTALELIDVASFDLILMDIIMPDIDGYKALRIIRQKEKYKNVPVMFFTGNEDIDNLPKISKLGTVDFIRKPFNGSELLARIRTHIELKKVREELDYTNIKLQQAYEKLEFISTNDPLTLLLNRREILRRMEYECNSFERNKRPFSVIIGDIDAFKQINDTYGHNYGDFILTSIAGILKTTSRKQDSISRWGGEELLLLLPDTSEKGAFILAEKLRLKIEKSTFKQNEISTKVTITFGVSVYKNIQPINKLIFRADSALYEGKQSGKNCVIIAKDL